VVLVGARDAGDGEGERGCGGQRCDSGDGSAGGGAHRDLQGRIDAENTSVFAGQGAPLERRYPERSRQNG